MGGRAFPAYVGVGQVARRQGRKVEVGEGSWHCNDHIVHCKGGFDVTAGEGGWHVVVEDEEEGERVDEEVGIWAAMVLLASMGLEIVT